jgi:hypothetical protein
MQTHAMCKWNAALQSSTPTPPDEGFICPYFYFIAAFWQPFMPETRLGCKYDTEQDVPTFEWILIH